MQRSTINNALIRIGLENALMHHNRPCFIRSDDPPTNIIFQSNQIVEPKYERSQKENITFPFKIDKADNKMFFTKNEFVKLQETNTKQLLEYYKNLLVQFESIKEGNKAAVNKVDMSMKRKHFYYCYLTSLINSPFDSSFVNLNQLIALKKLFMNHKFASTRSKNCIEQCCKESNCPQIAICGSSYCGWHILRDLNQSLYKKCPVCGWPCMKNDFTPCQNHRGKQKPQKKNISFDI